MSLIFSIIFAVSAALYIAGAFVYLRAAFDEAGRLARLAFVSRLLTVTITMMLAFRHDEAAALLALVYAVGAVWTWRHAGEAMLRAGKEMRGVAKLASKLSKAG